VDGPAWGLNDDVVAFSDRLAGAGFAVAAPDLYEGRLATTVTEAEQLSSSLDEDVADAYALAAVDALGEIVGDPDARLGALGFSMGAPWALWLPVHRPVVASVVYYGTMIGPSLSAATTPVGGHFAQDDEYEPEENVATPESAQRARVRAHRGVPAARAGRGRLVRSRTPRRRCRSRRRASRRTPRGSAVR
jgi:carboxymethylenebutenolidase